MNEVEKAIATITKEISDLQVCNEYYQRCITSLLDLLRESKEPEIQRSYKLKLKLMQSECDFLHGWVE